MWATCCPGPFLASKGEVVCVAFRILHSFWPWGPLLLRRESMCQGHALIHGAH